MRSQEMNLVVCGGVVSCVLVRKVEICFHELKEGQCGWRPAVKGECADGGSLSRQVLPEHSEKLGFYSPA